MVLEAPLPKNSFHDLLYEDAYRFEPDMEAEIEERINSAVAAARFAAEMANVYVADAVDAIVNLMQSCNQKTGIRKLKNFPRRKKINPHGIRFNRNKNAENS